MSAPNQQVVEGSAENAQQSSISQQSGSQPASQPGIPDAPIDNEFTFCKKFTQYVSLITENNRIDDGGKFKAAQELSEHLEFIVQNSYYNRFLVHLLNEFLSFIEAGEPIYYENCKAQIRKLVLEIIHRLPRNNDLEPHARRIQNIMFRLVEKENEDCALVCMRTIHELHKMFKPSTAPEEQEVQPEIRTFLKFVINSFNNLPDTMRRSLVNDSPVVHNNTTGQREPRNIPKATQSLKVLSELPLHVVVFYQTFQQKIEEDVSKLIHIMINGTLILHPEPAIKVHENFVQDAFVDFIMVQIKTISFLAYMIKHRPYHEIIQNDSVNFIKGLISCFRWCPAEAPHLRREVIVACRHLVAGDRPETQSFKYQMVDFMDELLDENVLIGTGWTNKEGSRCLAYSTLADFIHQVRDRLSLKQLAGIVYLFGKNVHDNDLTPSMQNMACKILINIVDHINKKSEKEGNYTGRDIMMRMLEVFVQKFQNIAKHQLPQIFSRCAKQVGTEIPTSLPPEAEALNAAATTNAATNNKKGQGSLAVAVQDCRMLVKTLVCGVKTITWGVSAFKHPTQNQQKFQPGETYLFIRLLKYGLQCLNIYRIQVGPPPNRITYIRAPTNNQIRSKEEKDIVDHFASVFIWSRPTFKEVFETQMDYLVESIHKNQSLSIIPHYFLTARDNISRDSLCSSIFAYQLARYLVEKLEDMGLGDNEAQDRPVLYSRLFKLLFTSVQMHGQEVDTEGILKPHLQRIVNQSMELAQTAKDPANYFALLRLLFRAIGSASGTYDEMYNEFLPLLPNLLQSLNRLQSGLHKQQMKDIFIELCLTVPVRLSNLLPYLPALMDPLVSALNGSNTLIAQGLRTLELCIDNLQPNFFYDKIEPVRAELIHALWQTLQNANENDNNAKSAYRVLGKFGARNRKTLQDPPKLEYVNPDAVQASVLMWFPNSNTPVKLPVQKVLDHALTILKSPNKDMFYLQHSVHVMQCYIISMINLSDSTLQIQKLLAIISRKQAQTTPIPHTQLNKNNFVCTDEPTRNAFKTALMGLFVATATKQLRAESTQFMMSIVRHFSLLTVVQQSGVFPVKKKTNNSLDVHVLVDVIAECMGSEEVELANIGEKAIRLVTETCKYILGSAERAFQIPFFDVLVEKLCGLCYKRAWYSKVGGVTAIEWLINNAPLLWTIRNQLLFINATLYVMMDLHEEVSYGTMGRAQTLYDKIIRHCNIPNLNPTISAAQEKVFHGVVHHLVKELISPYSVVRKQARQALSVLSEITCRTADKILEPLPKDLIYETVLPKKQPFFHMAENRQLACMEAVVYCSSLEPRLITLDVTSSSDCHKRFLEDVLLICNLPKSDLLSKYNCYKKTTNFSALKMSALKVLSSCHYLNHYESEIFKVMYKIMSDTDKELQQCAKDAIQTFQQHKSIEVESVHAEIRPLLHKLTDWKTLNMHLLQVLTHLMELFPTMFNEKLCDQLLKHLKKWFETSIFPNNPHHASRSPNNFNEDVLLCKSIINTFHLIPPPKNFFSGLISYIVRAEKCMNVEIGSPFQDGLFKFVLKHPNDAVDLFLKELHEPSMNRMFYNFLKHKDGGPLRDYLIGLPLNILGTLMPQQSHDGDYSSISEINMRYQEVLFQGILIISLLVKHDTEFLVKNREIVSHLRTVWNQPQFQEKFRNPDKLQVPTHQWREPKLLAKCMLNYLRHNPTDFELLFQLLNIFDAIYVPNINFLQEHIQKNVIEGFTVEQRRACFFKFVEIFQSSAMIQGRIPKWTQEIKGKILQYIIVPMFQFSFEKNETEQLIEGKPGPDGNVKPEDNIINVFMDKDNKIIVEDRDIIDVVRIHLLKLSAEFFKHAADYIHPTSTNRRTEGDKLRKLMRYAWPCIHPKSSHDPTTKYYGHLVLSLIISKFPIHKKIAIQVFHSLLKAHNLECRSVVFQALEIITPAMPARMPDGKRMLYHWTKKIIVEEGHTVSQLVHLLNLIVKQYRVYYLWRQYLIQHMLTAMQKFAFTQAVTIEHQRLACDLAEVVLKWEIQRVHETAGVSLTDDQIEGIVAGKTGLLINQTEHEVARYTPPTQVTLSPCPLRPPPPEPLAPFETRYGDGVFNFLLRLSYSAYTRDNNNNIQQSEALSKRCIQLVKLGMKPELEIFKNCSAKIYSWADRELQRIKSPPPSASSGNPAYFLQGICTILQLVEFLLDIVPTEVILKNIYQMSRGLSICMTSANLQITKTIHSLLDKMFNMFPIEPCVHPANSEASHHHEEVSILYDSVNEIIVGGLDRYEKDSAASASETLYSPLMILKAACATSPRYMERFLKEYIKCLQKLQKEHCSSAKDTAQRGAPRDRPTPNVSTSDLILVCVDLVKDQVDILINDIRKVFFANITLLIEKSPDPKLLKNLTEVVFQWVKNPSSGVTLKEKALLLTKMNQNYERHFPNDTDLMSTYLKIILHVYTEEDLHNELGSKLESAFMTGLRFTQPELRCKFTEVLKQNIAPDMPGRLLALILPHNFNWKLIGQHFWIKQFIEMLLTVNDDSRSLVVPNKDLMLPALTQSAVADPDVVSTTDVFSANLDSPGNALEMTEENVNPPTHSNVQVLAEKHGTFLESLKHHKSSEFVQSVCQLAHDNTQLANSLWVNIFPELWSILTKEQQTRVSRDLPQFLCSAMHQEQGDLQPSSIGCFLQSLVHVPIAIRPCYLKYLGSAHNAWHQMALKLEDLGTAGETFASFQLHQKQVLGEYPVIQKDETQDPVAYEAIDCLTALYSQLNEHDMWTGLWLRRCKYPETIKALSYQNLGFYELAQNMYEGAMKTAAGHLRNTCATTAQQTEFKLWKDQWIECTRQCSQWNILNEFAKSKGSQNSSLLLESSWRIPDWGTMKDVLSQADRIMPESSSHLVSLYRGYLALQQEEDPGTDGPVEKYWIQAINNALKQWRKLPRIVSNVHVPLLQFAQQAAELHESQSIHCNLLPNRVTQSGSKVDMKATLKAWRNRPPVVSDDIGHWNDIFSWRQYNHQKIIEVHSALESQGIQDGPDHPMNSLLQSHQQNADIGQHAHQQSAATMVTYASLARKHGLASSAQEWLARTHTIPSVHIMDCHKKLKEQIKTHLIPPTSQQDVLAALDVIEGINMRVLSKAEHRADTLAQKAHVLSLLGKGEEAMKTFSQAIQINDQIPGAWALWGQYCDEMFCLDKSNLYHAESAIACYLQACSKQKCDTKVRKYISRIFWLLTFDTAEESLSKSLEKIYQCVTLDKWLEWVPQLLAGLGSKEARVFHTILQNIGRTHPQALYFPIRNLYLTVRNEYQEIMARHKQLQENNPNKKDIPDQPPDLPRLRPRMAWCTKLLNTLREIHPTMLSALESIIDTLCYNMKEAWYDEVLHKLYTAIQMCEDEAFEIDHRQDVLNVKISQQIYNYIRGIMSYLNNAVSANSRSGRDSTRQPSIKQKFEADFDFSSNQGKKLHKVLKTLKCWVKMLDKSQSNNSKNYLEERCSFLSRICSAGNEVYLIGEYLNPKAHYIKIARFLPKIETIRKHSIAARRLFIRGSNGKVYPYLMVSTASHVKRARSEERFLQLMRMFNKALIQRKESCKRNLSWCVPKVVAVAPGSRLIEDNTSNISILEVYKWYCKNRAPEMEIDAPISYYYDQLGHMQNEGSVLNRIALNNIYHHIQTNILPPTVLLDWAKKTYPDPVMFWTFRQQITRHSALDCLAQFVLYLSSLKPEYIYITQETGTLSTIHYHFPINTETGEFVHEQPIPFRLTPNMITLMGPIAVSGLMVFSMISAARCLVDPKLGIDAMLHAILKDEVQATIKDLTESRTSNMVIDIQSAVTNIMNRLQTAASFDKAESKLPSVISLTTTPENLCRLDPAWYPWL